MAWKDKNVQIGSLLGPGAVVDGHFKTNGSARIDGEVKGNVDVESTLIIGETGKVDGDVTALSVTVGGEVLGDIDAQDRVELMEGAKVLGDITTKVLVIDENAIFQGKCNMYQDVPNKKNKMKKPLGGNKKSAKAAVFAAIAEMKEKEQEEAEPAKTETANTAPVNTEVKTEQTAETDNNTPAEPKLTLAQRLQAVMGNAPDATTANEQSASQNAEDTQAAATQLSQSTEQTQSSEQVQTSEQAQNENLEQKTVEAQKASEEQKTEPVASNYANQIPGINSSLLD